jgi:putative ABC transport system permease protein
MRRRLDEQMVTSDDTLPAGTTLEAGEFFADPDTFEASLQSGLARRLDIELGDTITLAFERGGEITVPVTSLRDSDWEETFAISFDIMIEPGAAPEAFNRLIATTRLPREVEQAVQDEIARRFPNVILIRTSDLAERISTQLGRIGWGIRFLSLFIIGAGLAVLGGAVGVETLRRGREVALLKTLGMTRLEVATAFATEYALIGFVASTIGVAAGAVLAYFTITRSFEFDFAMNPAYPAAAILLTTALCIAVGTLASTPALRRPPIDTLRSE